MKESINKAIIATNGKKTTATSLLMVAFQLLVIYKPDLFNEQTKRSIDLVISSGIISSLLHKAWRNRKQINTFILSKYQVIKKKIKK